MDLQNDYGDDFDLFEKVFDIIYLDNNGTLLREYQTVKPDILADPRRVWTMVEGDEGQWILCAGVHLVNAVGYVLTRNPWVTGLETVEYLSGDA